MHVHVCAQCAHVCVFELCIHLFLLRAFSDDVSTNNTDFLGRSFRVIPLVVELRPRLPPENLTLNGFLVPPHEVNPIIS